MISLRCHDSKHNGHYVPLRGPLFWECTSDLAGGALGVFMDLTYKQEHLFLLSEARQAKIYVPPAKQKDIDTYEDKEQNIKSAEE